MSDHVRKFDDWDIVPSSKPLRPPVSLESDPSVDPAYPATNDHTPGGDSSQESLAALKSSHTAVNPSVIPDISDSLPTENRAASSESVLEPGEPIVNPFSTHASTESPTLNSTHSPQSPDIDPDTGLPIPDYMKPFLNKN